MQSHAFPQSVSPPPDGWISLQELCAQTGVSGRNLAEWRRLGLGVPEPLPISQGRRGTVSYYKPETVVLIDRLNELRQQTRDADKYLWQLWLGGVTGHIRPCAKKHI